MLCLDRLLCSLQSIYNIVNINKNGIIYYEVSSLRKHSDDSSSLVVKVGEYGVVSHMVRVVHTARGGRSTVRQILGRFGLGLLCTDARGGFDHRDGVTSCAGRAEHDGVWHP